MSTLDEILKTKKLTMELLTRQGGEVGSDDEKAIELAEQMLLSKGDAYAAVRDELYTTFDQLAAREKEISLAKKQVGKYIERFEQRLIDTLLVNNQTELVGNEVVLKISPTAGEVEILNVDEAKLLYGRVKETVEVDKTAIRKALDSGESLSFARIKQNYSIKAKVKK